MASWSAVLALTGFHYSAVKKSMSFNAREGKHFWSNGFQYGTVEIKDNGKHKSVKLSSISGQLSLRSFSLNGFGYKDFEGSITVPSGGTAEFKVENNIEH
jgi:hypothetical protein